ncbi:hypothetical protein BJP65_08110 [Microbacterium sp. BH-3-3-3]|nr:hypothetical protein BJP65_08110 [Microbacterium sp. BH-3-3-3]
MALVVVPAVALRARRRVRVRRPSGQPRSSVRNTPLAARGRGVPWTLDGVSAPRDRAVPTTGSGISSDRRHGSAS